MVDFPIFFFLHQFSLPSSSTPFPRINFPKTICLCENTKIRWFFLALRFRKEYHCDKKKTNNIRRVFDIRQQQCIRYQRTNNEQLIFRVWCCCLRFFQLFSKRHTFCLDLFLHFLYTGKEKRERERDQTLISSKEC